MKIQSLSVVVPNPKCINNCAFCVSKMHCDTYTNQMDDNKPFFDLYLKDYIRRLEFARDNGCNTVMLTGNSEPQQNRKFLTYFGMFMELMQHPFRWIEMQTTGILLDQNYLRFLRNHVGVNLISLSVSALDVYANNKIIGTPSGKMINLHSLCEEIKRYDFSLRLSLNMTDWFDQYAVKPEELLDECRKLGANQITLRILYSSGTGTTQDDWVMEHAAQESTIRSLKKYITSFGYVLGVLPHGAIKHSINGMCVVIDDDCMDMSEKSDEDYKYLILQPDCKLYSQWGDPSSLVF